MQYIRISAVSLFLIVLVLFAGLMACSRPEPVREESFVFGTRVELIVAETGKDAADVRRVVAIVLKEFDRLHREYHAWQPSQLAALNQSIAAGLPYAAGHELAGFILDAQEFTRASDGLFDPGIGRLIALWGFQADEFAAHLPDPQALAAWRNEHPSILDLTVTTAARVDTASMASIAHDVSNVVSSKRGVAIDFGGYLKGVALDRAAHILRENGIHHALINIGGNVLALGTRYGQPWVVGLQHPRQKQNGIGVLATLPLADGEALGTSGDYQRFFEVGGERYHHLLDPRTAGPARGTQALTVLVPAGNRNGNGLGNGNGPDRAGTLSDVLSKPLFISGDEWPAMLARLRKNYGPLDVLRIAEDGSLQVTPALGSRLEWTDRSMKAQLIEGVEAAAR